MKCPFCQYIRTDDDVETPNWKCPDCDKVYSKYQAKIWDSSAVQSPEERSLEAVILGSGEKLFLAFACISILPLLVFKSEFNAPFFFVGKYLVVPIIIFFVAIFFLKMPSYRQEKGVLVGLLNVIIAASVISMCSAGFVFGINGLIGKQQVELIEGRVVGLSKTSSQRGGRAYAVSVKAIGSDKITKLAVSESEYFTISKGDVYYEKWFRGSLGMLYKR